MDNEETKILNHSQEGAENSNPQKRNAGGKTAYAVGGYATGVASGVADSAFAADSGTKESRIESHAELVDEQSAANESIKVLGVETVTDGQGNPMTVAAVEVEGTQSLLVDVDNNGTMDVIMIDENRDGQISEDEIYDVSDARIATADLQQMVSCQNPEMMTACDDGMPDYVNDADVSSMA